MFKQIPNNDTVIIVFFLRLTSLILCAPGYVARMGEVQGRFGDVSRAGNDAHLWQMGTAEIHHTRKLLKVREMLQLLYMYAFYSYGNEIACVGSDMDHYISVISDVKPACS